MNGLKQFHFSFWPCWKRRRPFAHSPPPPSPLAPSTGRPGSPFTSAAPFFSPRALPTTTRRHATHTQKYWPGGAGNSKLHSRAILSNFLHIFKITHATTLFPVLSLLSSYCRCHLVS
ncbi:hypothetical protein E2C01_040041 [Portunus trituberculatus]|uniref:Uncharacterized protein n=1 Tax=Portunus trituberculatus TaxID=210409 RepID=A0A5B7FPM7_PORTR|nr:hypothetical protein [Portunus trituberculatus]